MIRPVRRRLAGALSGALVAGTLALGGAAPAGAASPPRVEGEEEGGDPLTVRIDRLDPGAVPARGSVDVQGRIVNTSDQEWTELAVYLVTSRDPITTREELGEAVGSDPLSECPQVCSRLVDPGLFVTVPDLAPGESTRYRLSVPRKDLGISGEAGVYWLGVQVLGSNVDGRLPGADGRARTFLPLVPPRSPASRLALAAQLRNPVVRDETGRLLFEPRWRRQLSAQGRLGRLVELTGTAGDFPLSLVLDPAVLDAAESVAAGNPALDLGPTDEATPGDGQEGQDEPTDGPTTEDDEEEAPGAGVGSADSSPEAERAALRAGVWVEELLELARAQEVHRLPYGDLDVAALPEAETTTDLLTDALTLGDLTLREREVTSSPLVVPLSGSLPPAAVRSVEPEVPILLDGAVVPDGPYVRIRSGGGQLLLADESLVAGGPSPGEGLDALALRQRLLAEAALHTLSDERRRPLVAVLPADWDPGRRWFSADLFETLDQPWLRPTGLSELLGTTVRPELDPDDVVYTEEQREAQVPTYAVLAADQLRRLGTTMSELLDDESDFATRLDRLALLTASVYARERPGRTVARNRAMQDQVREWMDRILVRGPEFVTMSSEAGTFQVTLVNQLDRPVTVGLEATVSGESLTLTAQPETVVLEPKGRTSLQVDADAAEIGVHRVSLQPVTTGGEAVGRPLELSVRSSQVGLVVWVVMVVGGLLLLAAIAVRISRRITGRSRTRRALEQLETS